MSAITEYWHEPPLAGPEADHLVGALERLRATIRWKTDGLEAAEFSVKLSGAPMSPPSDSLRQLICDLIEEYGRHTGHADLIREAVAGRVDEDSPRDWRPESTRP